MAKRLLLIMPILLILLAVMCNPLPQSGINEIVLQNQFIESVDGDYQEITFASSLDGISGMHFADSFHNDSIHTVAIVSAENADSSDTTLSKVLTNDGVIIYAYNVSDDPSAWTSLILNFTVPTGNYQIDAINVSIDCAVQDVDQTGTLQVYDHNTDTWDNITTGIDWSAYAWYNYTIAEQGYWNDTNVMVRELVESDAMYSLAGAQIDYAELTFFVMTNAGANHYAESFADVSDITVNSGLTPTSDGDRMLWEIASGSGYKVLYTNAPSIPAGSYIEWSVASNHSHGTTTFRIRTYTEDGFGGTDTIIASVYPTTYSKPYRYYVANAVECLSFWGVDLTWDTTFYVDYIRISPPDELGYCHDGSSTFGVTGGNGGTVTSDGDILHLIDDGDGAYWNFAIDATSNSCNLFPDYYPFIELNFSQGNSYFRFDSMDYAGASLGTITGYTVQGSTTIFRYNFDAAETSETQYIRLTSYSGNDLYLTSLKIYTIANHTVSFSAPAVTRYAYVESGSLKTVQNGGTIRFQNDQVLSINTSTYPVYNFSMDDATGLYRKIWIDGGTTTETDEETRGALPTDKTITDYQFDTDYTCTISNIRFIEDSTAPSIVRSWAREEADTSDAVTLSAIVTDNLDVYKVYFDAITYPSGFSDTAYYATEIQDNLWNYVFSSLTAGHYTFKIVATDGVNENSLTEYAYIDFDVGSITSFTLDLWSISYLDVYINIDWQTSFGNSSLYAYDNDTLVATGTNEDFTLQFQKSTVIGLHNLDFLIDGGSSSIWKNDSKYEIAQDQIVLSNSYYGEDGNSWAFSATVNQDVNYYIYDNDTLQESGSKSTGFFQLSRDFVNTIGKHIVSIKFNTSSDSEWAGGSYDVDSTLSLDFTDPSQDNETVVAGFKVVRSASTTLTYAAYEGGLLRASGSISINEGDFFSISFDKSYVNIEGNATIIYSDGISSVNQTVIYITVDQADYTTVNGGSDDQYITNENNYGDNVTYTIKEEPILSNDAAAAIAISAPFSALLLVLAMDRRFRAERLKNERHNK